MNDPYEILSNSAFYPGRMWAKRLARLAVVFGIGLNIFINDFQEHTLELIENRSHEIAQITEEIDVEQLRIDRIESKSWTAYSMDWLAYFIDSPKANEVNRVVEFSNETLGRVEGINASLAEMDKGTTIAMLILRYTSMLMWIPIILSLIWLLIDLDKGNQKWKVGIGILLSIPFSYYSYQYLAEFVGMII
jgi:hypothetical protein